MGKEDVLQKLSWQGRHRARLSFYGVLLGTLTAFFFLGVYYFCLFLDQGYRFSDAFDRSGAIMMMNLWGVLVVMGVLLWLFAAFFLPIAYFSRRKARQEGIMIAAIAAGVAIPLFMIIVRYLGPTH